MKSEQVLGAQCKPGSRSTLQRIADALLVHRTADAHGSDCMARTRGWKRAKSLSSTGNGRGWAAAHSDKRPWRERSNPGCYLRALPSGALPPEAVGSGHEGLSLDDIISGFTGKTGSPIKVDLICPSHRPQKWPLPPPFSSLQCASQVFLSLAGHLCSASRLTHPLDKHWWSACYVPGSANRYQQRRHYLSATFNCISSRIYTFFLHQRLFHCLHFLHCFLAFCISSFVNSYSCLVHFPDKILFFLPISESSSFICIFN